MIGETTVPEEIAVATQDPAAKETDEPQVVEETGAAETVPGNGTAGSQAEAAVGEATPEIPQDVRSEYDLPATTFAPPERVVVVSSPLIANGKVVSWDHEIFAAAISPDSGNQVGPRILFKMTDGELGGAPIEDFMTTLIARRDSEQRGVMSILDQVQRDDERRRTQDYREVSEQLAVDLRVQMNALARLVSDGMVLDSGMRADEILTTDMMALMKAIRADDNSDPSLAVFGFEDTADAKDVIASKLFVGDHEKWGLDPSYNGRPLPESLVQSLRGKLRQRLMDLERVRKAKESDSQI